MRAHRLLLLAGMVLASGCRRELPDLPEAMIPEPPAADVETVLYLVGDAGDAVVGRSPLLEALAADVERWAGQLRGDTAVIVLFLGDNVYPDGMDAPTEEAYARDSTVMMSQVNVLAGANARRRAYGFFLVGNHDWGDARGPEGVSRVQVQQSFLQRRRAEGIRVEMEPEAGEPGPSILDVGERLRLLLYDTAWWLLAEDNGRKVRVFRQTEDALQSARGRVVIFASHHPFNSASSHGGNVAFWKTMGLRFLLARSGAILQDLNSVPYREFTTAILEAFRVGPPFIWAGGHDHNLQLIRNEDLREPRWSIVSGSASKVSSVGHMRGMQYRNAAPGYFKLFIRRDGSVDAHAVAAPSGEDWLSCSNEGAELLACVTRKAADVRTTYSTRLR